MSANLAITSMSASNLPRDQPLSHNDYPKVCFWFKKDWVNRKKEKSGITRLSQSNASRMTEQNKGRAPSGLNVSLRYVEDEHGVVIDGFRASDMRKFARSIWNQLHGAGKAPRSWGKADLDVAAHYRHEMRRHFPELGLCEFDWKAEQLATDNYPNWASNIFQGVKLEHTDPSMTQIKRRRDSVGHISKKLKIQVESNPTPKDVDAAPSSNVVNNTTDFPPTSIGSGSTINPDSIPPTTVTLPATLPSIVVSVHTTAPPDIEEPRHLNFPTNIPSNHANELSAGPVPTSNMLGFVNQAQELGEGDLLASPTTAVAMMTTPGPTNAVAMMTMPGPTTDADVDVTMAELPAPVTTDAPSSFEAVVKDGAAATAKTANSFQACMPRVRMF
jgi:hypothetical protein